MNSNRVTKGYGAGESITLKNHGLTLKVGYAAERDFHQGSKYGFQEYTVISDNGFIKTIKVIWYDNKESIVELSNDYFKYLLNPKLSWTEAQTTSHQRSNVPKCPTCGSTNVEKISLASKAIGGALFGLFSSNVRNTMHCKNCGYKW